MLGIGGPEILFVGLIALVVFGPGRLAETARWWGSTLGKARRWLEEAGEELASAEYPDEWFEDHDREQEDLFEVTQEAERRSPTP